MALKELKEVFSKEYFKKRFDTSYIEPDATDEQVVAFLEKCKKYSYYIKAVGVNLHQIPLGAKVLNGTDITLIAPVAYPLGCVPTELKIKQALWAIEHGARQIDFCMELGAFKNKQYDFVKRDLEEVISAIRDKVETISVIPFTQLLTKDELIKVAEIIRDVGADLIKTNPGYGYVTKVDDVRIIKEKFGDSVGVMASGGVRTLQQTLEMFMAGADRIATSTPFQILDEFERVIQRIK